MKKVLLFILLMVGAINFYAQGSDALITDNMCIDMIIDSKSTILDRQVYVENNEHTRLYVLQSKRNIEYFMEYLNYHDDIYIQKDFHINEDGNYASSYYFCNKLVHIIIYKSGFIILEFNYE